MPQRSAANSRGNLLAGIPSAALVEVFTPILTRQGCWIERIVSRAGDAFGPVILSGLGRMGRSARRSARVEVEGIEAVLAVGDHLLIPAGARHRVTFTDPKCRTVWLALHFDGTPEL